MADRQAAVKSAIAAMNSLSNIQQEQNKIKMQMFMHDREAQDSFFNQIRAKKEMMPLELEQKRAEAQIAQEYATPKKWEPTSRDEALSFEKDKLAAKDEASASRLSRSGIDLSTATPEEVKAHIASKDPGYSKFLSNVYEGKINLAGRSSQTINKVLEDVGSVYPDFDQSTAPARFKTRIGFTSGKEAQNIRSLNTATEHLNEFVNIIPELDNKKMKRYNTFANMLKSESGDPSIAKAKMIQAALSGELATLFKNSSGTDQEIANIKSALDLADSKEALYAVSKQAVNLMKGRMYAFEDQWRSSFGENSVAPVMSKRSKKVFESLSPDTLEPDTSTSAIPESAGKLVATKSRWGLK